jgi:hypothetical protein
VGTTFLDQRAGRRTLKLGKGKIFNISSVRGSFVNDHILPGDRGWLGA